MPDDTGPMVEVFVEVTNTLAVPFTSGFQRHTRRLLAHLGESVTDAGDGPTLHVVPIVSTGVGFIAIDAEARARLTAPAPPPAVARVERVTAGLPRPVGRALAHVAGSAPLRAIRSRLTGGSPAAWLPAGTPVELGDGAVLVDLEACWYSPSPRSELLGELRRAGGRSVPLIADVMPEQHPEWFSDRTVTAFGTFLRAHLESSDHFVTISAQTTEDLTTIARRLGRTRPFHVAEITLGADFDEERASDPPPAWVADRRWLLCVGTLEARKHQDLAMDVFDRLRDRHPDLGLVLVGREGPGVGPLVDRIERHPDLGDRLRWERRIDDDRLAALYRGAFLSLTPSRYEGYGLPVIEALSHGVPAIVSTGSALVEAGAGFAEHVDPDDATAWVDAVDRHLSDAEHHASMRGRLDGFRPPTWDAAARQLSAALLDWFAP